MRELCSARAPWRVLVALAGAALMSSAACQSPPRRDVRVFERSPDHPSQLGGALLATLTRARSLLDAGDGAGALALLEPAALSPDAPFAVRRLYQDAQLASGGDAAHEIEASARELAERQPSADNLLLWARVATRPEEARAAIDHALTLDPRNSWAHYAAAYARARDGDWVAASDAVQRALDLDPGHRAARRLEAAILARGARSQDAIQALRIWLEGTRDDPRFAAAERADAQLDLAHLLVLAGEPAAALEILRKVSPSEGSQLARWCLVAAAEQGAGRASAALEASQSAAQAAPDELLPLVQIAILREFDLGDAKAAREAWQRVLEATTGATDLGSLIQGLRARIVLERSAAEPKP